MPGHDQTHPHGAHDHVHHAPPAGWRYGVGIALNLAIVLAQAAAGFAIDSSALLADAGHNLSDVLGLGLAGWAAWLATRPGPARRTYGFAKAGVLAALVNGMLLVFASGAIMVDAIGHLLTPKAAAPPGRVVMAVAALALVVNAGSAWLLAGGDGADVNRRAAMLHLLGDAAVSAGVLVAGALIVWTGAAWIDPVASLLIVGVILWSSIRLLRTSVDMAMDAAPAAIDVDAVRGWLAAQPGVTAIHDLHVWPISATQPALTAHVVRPQGGDDAFLRLLNDGLKARFGIAHSTIQLETTDLEACADLGC